MTTRTIVPPVASLVGAALACSLAAPAFAQLSIPWWTVDGGGGTSSGGGLTVIGTIGQPDAGSMSGGGLTIACGYWSAGGSICYPNCDNSTVQPILNTNDFLCFLNRFAAGCP